MKYTSAQANKLLRKLQEERDRLLETERMSSSFVAATIENLEDVRPEYDFIRTQRELAMLEARIRLVKHAINLFNATHTVPGFDMTIDQMLVYIPQLSARKSKLADMAGALPKARREIGARANIIDYDYANYEIDAAKQEFSSVRDELARAQLALDQINGTATMEIDL